MRSNFCFCGLGTCPKLIVPIIAIRTKKGKHVLLFLMISIIIYNSILPFDGITMIMWMFSFNRLARGHSLFLFFHHFLNDAITFFLITFVQSDASVYVIE